MTVIFIFPGPVQQTITAMSPRAWQEDPASELCEWLVSDMRAGTEWHGLYICWKERKQEPKKERTVERTKEAKKERTKQSNKQTNKRMERRKDDRVSTNPFSAEFMNVDCGIQGAQETHLFCIFLQPGVAVFMFFVKNGPSGLLAGTDPSLPWHFVPRQTAKLKCHFSFLPALVTAWLASSPG